MGDVERRRATRVARTFIVRYQSSWSGERFWSASTLRNFSRAGARFLVERELKVASSMLLQLVLPTSKQPVWVSARVVWSRPAQWGTVDLGVEFEPAETSAVEAIAEAADFFLRKT